MIIGATAFAVACAHCLTAQSSAIRVHGVAFDSLRGIPLRNAVVAIRGMTSSAVTDQRGRFAFDGVPLGEHTFVMHHPSLDSIGFSGLSRRITVADSDREVRIGLPTFASLWRTACGGSSPPKDKGIVFGTIRHIRDGKPVSGAFVDVTWMDLSYDKTRGAWHRAHRGATRSDSTGGYVVCGVPLATWLRLDAAIGSASSGRIDLPPVSLPVQRRDLLLGFSHVDSVVHGVITGHVTDPNGAPFPNARVVVDDTMEVRSGPDGRFVLQDVVAGTRQVEILSIGVVPVVSAVDVFPGDTTTLAVALRRVTMLDVVQVTATRRGRRIAAEIDERRRLGFAQTMEAGELVAHATMATVFADFAGVVVEKRGTDFSAWVSDGRGGRCMPQVWIDGAKAMYPTLNMLRPREVTAVEVFSRAGMVPNQYRPVELKAWCGVILVWTNWVFGQ